MPGGIQQSVKLQTPESGFLGLDTVSEPTSMSIARSRRLNNGYMPKLKALGKRPGSAPVTDTALGAEIKHLTLYPFGTEELLASSDTSLYKYASGALTSVTMTDALESADIYDIDFTNSALDNRKLIADGGDLKGYDGTEVKDITPAADDPSPAPGNALADINTKGIKYIWEHTGHVFVSPGTNEVFYGKRWEYDYFPETQFELLVRKGDYVNGCGIPFDNVCFIPMRKGWNMWQGTNFDNFNASEYLNTINGVIAPRTPAVITYPTGSQTIAYLSDDGVHEIYTSTIDTQGRQYATRSLMKDKIDWHAFGFTDSEMAAAIAKYIVEYNMYLLEITRDTTTYVFGFDVRNSEWYIWTGLTINSLLEWQGVVYFAGSDGHLKQFDKELYSDWTDKAKTTGTPVDFDRISGMIWFEDGGYESTLDYYILRLKEYAVKASLDISIVYMQDMVEVQQAIKNYYLVWDIGEWNNSKWANLNYSELVSSPQRLSHRLGLPRKGYFFQIRLRNNRDEPCEMYNETLVGRVSGEI